MPTKKQKEVLDYIEAYQTRNGYAPSLKEIAKARKVASVSTAYHYIKKLEEEGLIRKEIHRPRTLTSNKISGSINIPLLGYIAAGQPIEAIETLGGAISLSKNEIGRGKHYALKVQGDSMIDEGIFDGDIVVIKEQSSAEDGQTVVAIIDDNEATLKRIYREKGRFRLQPANQNLLPFYRNEVEVRGVVVKIVRNLEDKDKNTVVNQGYEKLKKVLNELNFQQYHFVNSNDICTPMGCVEEMVDSIPDDFWKKQDLKVLDPCAGNGNFHAYIQTKTKLSNLVFNDINEKRLANVRKIFGTEAKITKKDFFKFEDKEEYDLVVANPPFAKFTNGERTAKNHNLSRDFILKALTVTKKGGFILFIVPDNWMSFADNNKVPSLLSEHQFVHLNIHGAKKWFPQVGSSFTWFLLQKLPNKKHFTVDNNYKIKRVERATVTKGTNFIPLYYSEIIRSIVEKTIHGKGKRYAIQTSSNLHKFTKKLCLSELKSKQFKYKIHHTPSQIVWSKVPHIYQQGWKVFISLTNQYSTFIDTNCGMTQSIAFIRCTSKQEAERLSKQLNHPLYVFLNNITRYGNFNNIRVLQNFPIYKDFGLTKKEMDFITEFNNNYFKTKKIV